MKKIVCIIPSRYNSSRFPGKPLAIIHGKPMIQWVYESVKKVKQVSKVYVATDNTDIFNKVLDFGGNVIMTGEHESGTSRIIEALSNINEEYDVVINLQGDEPTIKREMIEELISIFNDDSVVMGTLKKQIYSVEDITDPNIVKVITDLKDDAVYFSRAPIPYNRENNSNISYFKHIGLYGYTPNFLNEFSKLEHSYLDTVEMLEQLKVIENGYKIRVKETKFESFGVDMPDHIKIVEKELLLMNSESGRSE